MRSALATVCFSLAVFTTASVSAQTCNEAGSNTAVVEDVYPTAGTLPENLLRFYIYFSEPMARDGIWDSVVLLDAKGAVVHGAFIENKFDLWSPDDRRLTVLFDPGRVKTGLVAHNTLGRALEAGNSYSLKVLPSAETRSGCGLAAEYSKVFTTSEADYEAPDLKSWIIDAPIMGTIEPLRVMLDGPADHLSMAYRIRVSDPQGNRLGGSLRLDQNEKEWIFTPRAAWADATYQLEVNTALEDIVGNRLTGLFDRPVVKDGYSEPAAETMRLPFRPRKN